MSAKMSANIPSPCINICRMDPDSGLCSGCFRSLEEIAAWGRADDGRKIAILAAVERRRRDYDPNGESLRGDCDR